MCLVSDTVLVSFFRQGCSYFVGPVTCSWSSSLDPLIFILNDRQFIMSNQSIIKFYIFTLNLEAMFPRNVGNHVHSYVAPQSRLSQSTPPSDLLVPVFTITNI